MAKFEIMGLLGGFLPQMPQLPQPKVPARRVITDEDDGFEERAAMTEYVGGMPRPLAEFLAKGGTAVESPLRQFLDMV